MKMPTVLITGANRGIGLEFARQYAELEWSVFAACRSPAAAKELAKLANSAAGKVSVLGMDVTDGKSVSAAARQLGKETIDLLINNAGTSGASGQRIGHIDYQNWAQVLDVNTMGPLRVVEAFVDHVARSERALIVTITSGMSSLTDNTSGGSIAYRSSKAAVNMGIRSAAAELAPRGIICVVVNPGWVKTRMGGAGAPLPVEDSVSAMRALFERLQPNDGGRFFNYDGSEHPW
jgi:NAD(P)-dependent dehydrogenase (short-subunit alcohol dehydrogenase family)